MAVKAEVKIIADNSKNNIDKVYETMWEFAHGANPQQDAGILKSDSIADFDIIGDNILTYNELKTAVQVTNLLSEFYDVNASVLVNNTILCGVALGTSIEDSCQKVIDTDPISVVNGAIGCSKKVDLSTAELIYSVSASLIIAPDFDEVAVQKLLSNPNTKIVKLNTPLNEYSKLPQKDIQVTPFGIIYQDFNHSQLGKSSFNIVSKTKPTKEQIEDAVFAWKISKYTNSNSVVISKDFKTSAVVQGFSSSVNAVEYALDLSCEASKDSILSSDDIINSVECIYAAAQGRISTIIQPGGSVNDTKIIEAANKYNIVMIFTGIKNYKY